jgi:hypothetical protein
MLNHPNSTTRGVIQLANKRDKTQFDQKDKERIEKLSVVLGRFQNVIFCLEDFFSAFEKSKKEFLKEKFESISHLNM